MKRKILARLTLTAFIIMLSFAFSLGEALAREEPSIRKVRGEGLSFQLDDEREVRTTAIDDALKKAVIGAYETLVDPAEVTAKTERLKRSVLSRPLNYILDYRVLSEGWIRHLVIEPDLPVPPVKETSDISGNDNDTLYGGGGSEDGLAPQEQGLRLYHVWVEASVDFKALKNDLSLTPSFEGENTSLVTILLITITDYKNFTSLKEAIEDLDNVKEVTLDSFLKGKIVLTAEVWGNPHEMLEKLKANKNLHDLDIIPSGMDRITIKGVIKR
jgi:hypothetical protein